jgi:metal-sulfur cluster biosynthetic enzyme
MAESEISEALYGALQGVYDPCCRELGLSIIDMGVVRSAKLENGVADVKLTLTSGWCPSMAGLVSEAKAAISALPEVGAANVAVIWDEVWSPEQMSDGARAKLRFLPPPKDALAHKTRSGDQSRQGESK